jgi:hypothetical protein
MFGMLYSIKGLVQALASKVGERGRGGTAPSHASRSLRAQATQRRLYGCMLTCVPPQPTQRPILTAPTHPPLCRTRARARRACSSCGPTPTRCTTSRRPRACASCSTPTTPYPTCGRTSDTSTQVSAWGVLVMARVGVGEGGRHSGVCIDARTHARLSLPSCAPFFPGLWVEHVVKSPQWRPGAGMALPAQFESRLEEYVQALPGFR